MGCFRQPAYDRLEPDAGKLARPVLRGMARRRAVPTRRQVIRKVVDFLIGQAVAAFNASIWKDHSEAIPAEGETQS